MLRTYLPAIVFLGLGAGIGLLFTMLNSLVGVKGRKTFCLRRGQSWQGTCRPCNSFLTAIATSLADANEVPPYTLASSGSWDGGAASLSAPTPSSAWPLPLLEVQISMLSAERVSACLIFASPVVIASGSATEASLSHASRNRLPMSLVSS